MDNQVEQAGTQMHDTGEFPASFFLLGRGLPRAGEGEPRALLLWYGLWERVSLKLPKPTLSREVSVSIFGGPTAPTSHMKTLESTKALLRDWKWEPAPSLLLQTGFRDERAASISCLCSDHDCFPLTQSGAAVPWRQAHSEACPQYLSSYLPQTPPPQTVQASVPWLVMLWAFIEKAHLIHV